MTLTPAATSFYFVSGTLGGFPNPPAMSSGGQSPPAFDAIVSRNRGGGSLYGAMEDIECFPCRKC